MELSDYTVVCVDLETNKESPEFTIVAPTSRGHETIVARARSAHPDMQVDRYSRPA